MRLYAFYFGVPLALLIQHLYEVTNENFRKRIPLLVKGIIIGIASISIWSWRNKWIDIYICVEMILVSIVTIIISYIICRKQEELPLDEYQSWEYIVPLFGMLFGLFCCMLPEMDLINKIGMSELSGREAFISKGLYMTCGISYLFYNRVIICKVYEIWEK